MGKSVYFLVKLHQLLPRNKLNSSSLLSFKKNLSKTNQGDPSHKYNLILYLLHPPVFNKNIF